MAIFLGKPTVKSQRKDKRKSRKADRSKMTKTKAIAAAKLRAQGKR